MIARSSRFPHSQRISGRLSIGTDDVVFDRATVQTAFTIDPFGRAHAVGFKNSFPHKQSAASHAGDHHRLFRPRTDLIVPRKRDQSDHLLLFEAIQRSQEADPPAIRQCSSERGEGERPFPID